MTAPWENGWFIAGVLFAVLGVAIRVVTDRSTTENYWTGINIANVLVLIALALVIIAIVQGAPTA